MDEVDVVKGGMGGRSGNSGKVGMSGRVGMSGKGGIAAMWGALVDGVVVGRGVRVGASG